jgi:hypothetical protein
VGVNCGTTQPLVLDGRDRGFNSFFMSVTDQPLREYTLSQDVTGLPAGKYRLTCFMFVQNAQRHGSQRLFANNHVQFFGKTTDYNLDNQLGYDEKAKYVAGQLTVSYAGYTPGENFRLMSLDVVVKANETLTLGLKTSNVTTTGTIKSGVHQIRADHFQLELLEPDNGTKFAPATAAKIEKSAQYYTLTGMAVPATAKGLLLKKVTYTDGSVKVEKVVK